MIYYIRLYIRETDKVKMRAPNLIGKLKHHAHRNRLKHQGHLIWNIEGWGGMIEVLKTVDYVCHQDFDAVTVWEVSDKTFKNHIHCA